MRNILFLGGNGFLGKNVLSCYPALPQEEALHFIVTGRKAADENAVDSASVSYRNLEFSNREALRDIFSKQEISEVFHFISATVPSNSNTNIFNDIQTNLLGSIALLELMAEYKVSKITYISSGGAVYGDSTVGASQEEDFNNPNNSYGIVKLTIEKYIALFHKLHGIDYLILRLSNPFGAHHHNVQNGIINIAIRKGIQQEPVVVWGDGLNTKDYIYAPDFARIFWKLRAQNVKNQILNIGSGNLYSIIDLLKNIQKIIPDLTWTFEPAKSFDTRKVAFRLDSLKKIMPIENTPFLDALRATWEWEQSFFK